MSDYRRRLERAKRDNTAQLLFKCSRLLNERALDTLPTAPGESPPRPSQMALLPHIDLESGTRVTELAAKLGITKQGVGQLVDDLESRGWLERRPDPTDGRAKRVHFTAAGRAAIFDGLNHLKELEKQLTRALGKPVMQSLHGGLLKLHDYLEEPGASK